MLTATHPVELRRCIGYVVQEIALFPHLTVMENINIVQALFGWSASKMKARADELLDMEELPLERSIATGCQKQHIGVLRVLAADPQVILMDEQYDALDPISRDTLQNELVSLQKGIRKTIGSKKSATRLDLTTGALF